MTEIRNSRILSFKDIYVNMQTENTAYKYQFFFYYYYYYLQLHTYIPVLTEIIIQFCLTDDQTWCFACTQVCISESTTQFKNAKSKLLRFLLYLEWSREVNFFCFLQAQSNEGNVGRISEGNKDKYVADLCNPYDINSQQSKHMIAGQQDLSFF